MLADAATLWQIQVNAICSLRSCDWSHWDPTILWPKLPDLWQQRHSETVEFFLYSFPFGSFVDPREDHYLHCTIISLEVFFGVFLRVSGSRTNLFMRFKSTAKSGLLLWRGESPMRANSDFLSMGLQDGALIFRWVTHKAGQAPALCGTQQRQKRWNYCRMSLALEIRIIRDLLCKHEILCYFCCFSYNLGSGTANIAVNGTFNDGKWHRVKAVR